MDSPKAPGSQTEETRQTIRLSLAPLCLPSQPVKPEFRTVLQCNCHAYAHALGEVQEQGQMQQSQAIRLRSTGNTGSKGLETVVSLGSTDYTTGFDAIK